MPESLEVFEQQYLNDLEYLYRRSYEELKEVFETTFQVSDTFKEMVIEMNSNMIQYRFMRQAGFIKD